MSERGNLNLGEGDVICHAYWRSMAPDVNGDGVGDCKGLTAVLPILKDIGFTSVWVAPFFKGPGHIDAEGVFHSTSVDQGYDVEDFYDVDPQFGTLEDVDELMRTAAKLDLKLLIDIVPCHTSDKHAHFQDALRNPDSPYRSWYVIERSRHGSDAPPTQSCSVFGEDPNAAGSMWSRNPYRPGEWYLHQFHAGQPALNGANPEVQQYIADVIKHWADKGFQGARIDAGKHFVLDQRVRTEDEPYVAPTETRPYARWNHPFTVHVRGRDGQNMSAIALGNVARAVREQHPRFYFVQESTDLSRRHQVEYAAQGLDVLDHARSGVDAGIGYVPRDATQIARTMLDRLQGARQGVGCVGFDRNHDTPNFASCWEEWVGDPRNPSPEALRTLTTLLLTSPGGGPVILYGVPLGVGIGEQRRADGGMPDPRGREQMRQPTNWGIPGLPTPAWIPQHPDPRMSVAAQLRDRASHLNYVKRMIPVWKQLSVKDDLTFNAAPDGVLDYGIGPFRVVVNLGNEPIARPKLSAADVVLDDSGPDLAIPATGALFVTEEPGVAHDGPHVTGIAAS